MSIDYNADFFPFYAHLSSVEKTVYRQILPEILMGNESIKPSQSISSSEASNVIHAIYYDRPDLFWLTGSSSIATINGIVSTITLGCNHLRRNLEHRKRQLERSVDYYLRSVKGVEPFEQERAIHDQMVRAISYLHHAGDQTSYSALVEEKAVCAGYSRAFQLLMQRLNIPCFYCGGTAIGPKDKTWGPHAWNIIKLDEDYYNVDITWNDCYDSTAADRIDYTYFNCSDSKLLKNHRRDSEHAFLPSCNGMKYSFEKIYGTTPELELVYQDGVTCRTPVIDKQSFIEVVEKALRNSSKQSIVISFPLKGEELIQHATDWFKEAVCSVFPHTGWQMKGSTRDYCNGWYRVEFYLKLK